MTPPGLTAIERAIMTSAQDALPGLIGELARLEALAWVRLQGIGQPASQPALQDQLLTVSEAARKLCLTEDYLYRHARDLPFTVRTGRHVRFSLVGIERYIRQRQGR